jgi:epoxide hydrolase-like predicted phosphatase
MSIDAVLWDFGGIFTPSPFGAAHAYAESEGIDPVEFVELVFGKYDDDTDHVWHQLERGEVTMVDALAQISAEAQARGLPFDLFKMFTSLGQDHDRTIVVETVRKVREHGVRTAIVTNNIREYGDAWRGMVPVDELFDVIVDSCEEGIRKPDPRIFMIALERLGVENAERAVFLDDFDGNINAARALGMHGILVTGDPQPAMDELLHLVTS